MRVTPYISSEDSALLREAIRGRSGGACLEIGAGNGGTLVELGKRFEVVAGTDLAEPDMLDWRAGANYLLADGASCFPKEVFDLVVFNPPYLGGEALGDQAVDGGERLEAPLAFLMDALRVVKKRGRVVFLLNQEAEVSRFEELCSSHGFGLRRLVSRDLFFEVLSVYEAEPLGPKKGSLSS